MNEASITLQARAQNWTTACDFILEHLLNRECPDEIANIIAISAEEIFVNVSSYAYEPEDGEITIKLCGLTKPRGVRLAFSDNGRPYNPLLRPDPDLEESLNERKIGGLGIYLVKKNMDKVFYEYDGGRNIFTIEKNY